jgi:hypothetical protein
MKKHIFTISCLFICLVCANIQAQNSTTPVVMQPATAVPVSSAPASYPSYSYGNLTNTNFNNWYNNNNYSQYNDYTINGNRYFYDDNYRTGELWTKNGHYLSEMLYRVDQLDGTIQVKLQDGKQMMIDVQSIIMLHLFIKGKKIVFVTNDIPDGRKNALLQVIYYSSNFQLLRDSKKSLMNVTNPNKVGDLEVKSSYQYYITENDSKPIKKIYLTEKELTKVFPEHRNKIVQFFKVNDTKEELTQTKLIKLLERITQEENKVEKKD